MSEEITKRVQQTGLEILTEVDRICQEEGIRYFLFYGTLIGAVRHEGFIPWDDDVDIVLLRDQYEKLLEIFPKRLDSKYWLQSFQTDEQYWQPFAKVRKKGTLYKEKHMDCIPDEKSGIWIDIFPLDSISKRKIVNKIACWLINNMVLSLKKKALGLKFGMFSRRYIPGLVILDVLSVNTLKKSVTKLMTMFNNNHNDKCAYCVESQHVFAKSAFDNVCKLPFEGKMFSVPEAYDDLLKECYGDYMQLPPVNHRWTHTPEKVVF